MASRAKIRGKSLEQFQKNMRGRLKHWKEEEHRADKALADLGTKQRPR
jgi:hypothetical protein